MASTPVEFAAPSGLTLTVKLFAMGSDTIANGSGDTATENTNNLSTYSITVTEALSGWHRAQIETGASVVVASGLVYLEDTTTRRYVQDDIASALALVDGKTVQEALRIIGAVVAGELPTGAGTGTETFRGLDGATDRVTVTVDTTGNRTDVTYG